MKAHNSMGNGRNSSKRKEPSTSINNKPNEKINKGRAPKESVRIDQDLYQRFYEFNIQQSFSRITKEFKNLIGRHSVVEYIKEYGFRERWQYENWEPNSKEYKASSISAFFRLTQLILIFCCLWGISTYVIFEPPSFFWVFIILIVISCSDIFLLLFKFWGNVLRLKGLLLVSQIVCIVYAILNLEDNLIKQVPILNLLVSALIAFILYKKSVRIYTRLKIFHVSSRHRDFINLFDLFLLMLTAMHIFAMLLYFVSTLNPDNNWIMSINTSDREWDTLYVYSVYFSSSTLLTVGYGDISPVNKSEIFAVLLTQIFGIVVFAYTVNEIGATLSSLQESNQILKKDLGNVEIIGNSYRLEPEVVCRMRSELTKRKIANEDLIVKEENQLLGKFSDDLRISIQFESSMKVIKRSLFMICNWTGKFQAKLATKLVKEIYSAEEFLPQYPGKEKLYIIDRGRVDIMNSHRFPSRACFKKILKTLKFDTDEEIAVGNVYGYSTVISNHKIHLNAVARQSSVCYTISKDDFFKILSESEEDLEHLHELKCEIDLNRIPQQIEAPAITNIREHYQPSYHYLISQDSLKSKPAKRKPFIRRSSKLKMVFPNKRRNSQNHSEFSESLIQNTKDIRLKASWEDTIVDNPNHDNILLNFECCKEYQRFYKKSNIENVVKKLNQVRYQRKLRKPSEAEQILRF